jgi:hypothetical protein
MIMKKYTILLVLCLAFSYVKAQTILVNSNVISVHEDVAFPFWLDSMSTIEIGTQVVSISALEFNIVPANNGNSLVFSQTKTITSQETVPNGTTWKITAVLLDSTAINNSSSNGGGQVIVSGGGGNMPVALSEEINNITMGDAMIYCDSLQEGGYDNWVVPSWEELMFSIGGGISIGGTRNNIKLWTSTFSTDYIYYFMTVSTIATAGSSDPANLGSVRCVRHESISVSGSGGSNTPSTLGSGMPTMISNESAAPMNYGEAALYCDSLSESGYSDWILPSYDQITYAMSGGCIMTDSRTENRIWTRTIEFGTGENNLLTISLLPKYQDVQILSNSSHESYVQPCRCVR